MARDKAIVISTHLLEEVSAVCTRAVVIAQGKIVFDGSPDEFAAKSSTHNYTCWWSSGYSADTYTPLGVCKNSIENGGEDTCISADELV